MGENIGAAARAMMNFGMSDLRLVRPRDGWPNAKAHETSAKADGIIEAARVYGSLTQALHDCTLALATTAAERNMALPHVSARDAGTQMRSHLGKVALVFGRESHGLSGEEIACCHAIVSIPTAPDYTSLNLAQAVTVLAYEWWMAAGHTAQTHPLPESATMAEIEALHTRLLETLAQSHYFRSSDKTALQALQMRQLLIRPQLLRTEVQAWHGIMKALSDHMRIHNHPQHGKAKHVRS